MELEKRGIKILLMVEHIDRCNIDGCNIDRSKEMPAKTVYMIEPPTDVADYEEKEIDSDGFMMDIISPVITIDNDDQLLKHCAMVRLGSRIYFFGGISNIQDYCVHAEGIEPPPPPFSDELKLSVRFVDVDHLELGLCRAASLNAPKEVPCVFSARGMIYALGSSRNVCNSVFTLDDGSSVCSGIFERYDPVDDKWQLLPDPPLPFGKITKHAVTWCDSATLIGDRYVFMGNTDVEVFVLFDLDTQDWSLLPAAYFQYHFPYGSLCVDNSLYYLIGYDSYKFGTQFDTTFDRLDQEEARRDEDCDDDFNLQIVKRGPLLVEDDPSKLFDNLCLRPGYKQLMTRLDQVTFLLDMNNSEWRDIFHLGGRFFCYVVTAQLYSVKDLTRSQPYCRGVWIDVLEEVELPASKSTHFRTLASFSYRIRTPFENAGLYIRCCAFGSVPDSWVKEPLKKKLVAKERETFKAEIQHDYGGGSKGQGDCNLEENVVACVKEPSKKKQVAEEREHDHDGGSKGQGHCNLEKIVAVAAGDEEIIRLKAELAKKDAVLAEKDAELAEKEALVKRYELLFVADRITVQ